jgi:hypothetical protein
MGEPCTECVPFFPDIVLALKHATDESDHVNTYRRLAAKFYFHYAMLIVNSFGLQNALERSAVDIGHFFARCHSSAVACARVLRDETGPVGYLRYATDSTYVMASYALLSLLKVGLSLSRMFSTSRLIVVHSFSSQNSRSSLITSRRLSPSLAMLLTPSSKLLQGHYIRPPYMLTCSVHSSPPNRRARRPTASTSKRSTGTWSVCRTHRAQTASPTAAVTVASLPPQASRRTVSQTSSSRARWGLLRICRRSRPQWRPSRRRTASGCSRWTVS